jgi:voltage-gated sodium channel
MSLRERVRQLVEARAFQQAIMAVIVLNAGTLGAATSPRIVDQYGGFLDRLDKIALTIFVFELAAKFYVYRLRFFRDPWNCFDFVVVGIALVPNAGAFSVLRALRVLRMLRLISMVPSMRRVVSTLLAAIPGVLSIVGLLVLLVYVFAVMGTSLFADAAPDYFGDLGQSLWTLFQTLTGEAWPDIAADVMAEEPMAWIFFLLFILITTFVVLNLFLAVVVGAMESVRDEEEMDAARIAPSSPAPAPSAAATPPDREVLAELAALRQDVAALRGLLETSAPDPVPRSRS